MEGTSAWWREHKKLTDNMLEKEDQGETVEEEQENIQKRRECYFSRLVGLLGKESKVVRAMGRTNES